MRTPIASGLIFAEARAPSGMLIAVRPSAPSLRAFSTTAETSEPRGGTSSKRTGTPPSASERPSADRAASAGGAASAGTA